MTFGTVSAVFCFWRREWK